ncbi:hypothetical protein [Wenyingzhuangia sp. IMCC45574]
MKIKLQILVFTCFCLAISCSDNKEEVSEPTCNKTCDTGFILNEETCECEQEPCPNTCDMGSVLNSETCDCEEREIKYGEDYIVFEPQVTKSDLGLWKQRRKGDTDYYPSTPDFKSGESLIPALNDDYLEFTGNNLNGGTPTSPLEYDFVAPKDGDFRIVMRMLQPLQKVSGTNHYEEGDKRNDVWIKLQGDFETACVYPTTQLKGNKKFWGRGVRKWGSIFKLESHVDDVKKQNVVVYRLKKDKSYKLTMSGRAQGCSIDYILLYERSLESSLGFKVEIHTDIAEALEDKFRP